MEKIVVSCLESRIDENQNVYSRFLLGPFLSGHAVTVATALRRALLSEVKNIAITALHIQGVTHEFSTLVGIRESVLELSLNFQQIILSTQTKSRSVQIGYLHVQGPAIVHANDLKLPDGIECVNPSQYIATLSTEGLLVVKFLIGEKKSFLKSNTSTLNSKKIKEAKIYSAQLSKSLLSHAEYDPPRLFRLLRNQSLPNGAIVRRTIEGESTFRLAPEGAKTNFLPESSSDSPRMADPSSYLDPKGPNLVEPTSTKMEFLMGSDRDFVPVAQKGGSKQTQKIEGSEPPAGSLGSKSLESDLEQLSLSPSESARTSNSPRLTNSILDQSANRISDEFNSEVCLRTIIPLDPIFTPVYQVNFGIERDDLSNQIRERVIMEVWTNGSIHPRQAINEAALSTMSMFSKLRKTFQLDSHSLALSANSTAPLASFARGSRLHKTKSITKVGVENDDSSESVEPLSALRSRARSVLGSLVRGTTGGAPKQPSRSSPGGAAHWLALLRRAPVTRKRFAPVAEVGTELGLFSNGRAEPAAGTLLLGQREAEQAPRAKRRVNYQRFALARSSVTELDLTNFVRQKLNRFSSLGFVRSRHPVSFFLQNFGRSHIRGQTFLLEQSFGLKARFFKGHRTVLSKSKYTSGGEPFYGQAEPAYSTGTKFRHPFKRTFLPSFKVVLGLLGSNRNDVSARSEAIFSNLTRPNPEQNQAGLTKASLLFKLRFYLAGTAFEPFWLGSRADRAVNQVSIGLGRLLLALSQSEQESGHGFMLQSRQTFALAKNLKAALSPQIGANFSEAKVSEAKVSEAKVSEAKVSESARSSSLPSDLLIKKVSTSKKGGRAFRLSKNRSSGRLNRVTSWSSVQITQPSKTTQSTSVSKQLKSKPIVFLIKYRTFSFTRNALRIFRSKQEDSLFLLPLAKQLIRVKMARVFTSYLPLISKRSEPTLTFNFTENQALTPVDGKGRLDIKQILLSLAALRNTARSRVGLETKPLGSQSLAEQAPLLGELERSRPPARSSSAVLSLRLRKKGPESIFSNRLEKTGRSRPVGWSKEGLELRANSTAPAAGFARVTQKRIASLIALRALTPFDQSVVPVNNFAAYKLWQLSLRESSRSNLKKQFGFFQFACNGLRAGRQRSILQGSTSRVLGAIRSATTPSGLKERWMPELRSAWPRRGVERLGVCVSRTELLANQSSPGGVRSAKRNGTAPFEFTTFPLIITKAPPLCFSTGLVTLLSYRGPTYLGLDQKRPKSEPAVGGIHPCFTAVDLFGFNSDVSVRSESLSPTGLVLDPSGKSKSSARPFQLTPQAGTEFRLSTEWAKRLSILYSSNLDKMSFLSSDLANISLSLKTYTFLKKKGKNNIASLLEYSPTTLFSLLNGDDKMFHEIERCLLLLGLPFKERS